MRGSQRENTMMACWYFFLIFATDFDAMFYMHREFEQTEVV